MGVMEQFRSGTDSTGMQVLLAAIVVSFIGWYAIPSGEKSSIVATVNGVKIMDTRYNRTYRNALRNAEQRYGRTMGDEEQKQLGEQVRQQLIEDEVVLQEAQSMRLDVSDTEVARQLLDRPYLLNESGSFDEELYGRFLKRNQLTRADYEQTLREDLLRIKLRTLVFMGASISEPALKEAFIEDETKIDLQYVRVRAAAFADDVVVTDEERAAWLAENAELVDETYERDFQRLYNHPESVHLRLIRLGTADGQASADLLPRINEIRDQIEDGADFDELARRWSEDPSAARGGDLGLRPMPQLASDVSSAVRDVPAGSTSRAITTDNDVRVYLVEAREAPRVDSLDDVRDDIADRLIRDERVPALAAAFAEEQLLVRWTDEGAPPSDLLDPRGLVAATTGPRPARPDDSPFSPPPAMIKAARDAEVGAVLPEVYEANGMLWVGQLKDRIDADMKLFEDQKDQIRSRVLANRRLAFYQSWVSDVKAHARIQ